MLPSVEILSCATVLPENILDASEFARKLPSTFPGDPHLVGRIRKISDACGIRRRHLAAPPEWLEQDRSHRETSEAFLDLARDLAMRATAAALRKGNVAPQDVDLVVLASCTGFPMPSLDADIVDQLGFRADVTRLPIAQAGCAGGAVSLARAGEILRGRGGGTALVIAVELPSLSFSRRDTSVANLISLSLFGDGAAATLISTEQAGCLRLLASRSHQFPSSRALMGSVLTENGFSVVLDPGIPRRIRREFPAVLADFLGQQEVAEDQLSFHLLHPGGPKILSSVEKALGLKEAGASISREVFAECGNMSGATVLFVLDRQIQYARPAAGELGILAAFGPGFSAELQLWQGTGI